MARRRRMLVGASGLVVASVGGGFVAARQITSPSDAGADARPPIAGPISAPLEQRALHSELVVRGDAVFDDAVDVRVDTTHVAGAAVLTSDPPAVGTTIDEGQVMFEIAGRPVIALGGDLPTYRDLAPGATGPDVRELEVALKRLGYDPGVEDDNFDSGTSAAIDAMYAALGYPTPTAPATALQRVAAATTADEAAHDDVVTAYAALGAAMKGPKESEKLALENAVKAAQRALTTAQQGLDPNAIADANDALQLARAQRTEGLAPPDVAEEQAAVAAAQLRLTAADAELAAAVDAAGTPMPAAELVFVPALPRRVDATSIERGALVNGPLMSISGSTVVVEAELEPTDRSLVAGGMAALVSPPSGPPLEAHVESVVDSTATSNPGGAHVVLSLDDPTDAQLDAIRGQNVKVTMPIAATSGEVLCAPIAALTAGPGGESRVEVLAVDGTTHLVEVSVGLVAEGYAEIDDKQGVLAAGNLVVVGR